MIKISHKVCKHERQDVKHVALPLYYYYVRQMNGTDNPEYMLSIQMKKHSRELRNVMHLVEVTIILRRSNKVWFKRFDKQRFPASFDISCIVKRRRDKSSGYGEDPSGG